MIVATEYRVAVMTVNAAYPDAPQSWVEAQARRALADPDYYQRLVLRVERTAQEAVARLTARVNSPE